jgi:hypothetical protein
MSRGQCGGFHNLGFIDRSRYFFLQVASPLYSQSFVDPVPDPLLLIISGSAGNRIRTSGSVARNSDHWATEAVDCITTIPEKAVFLKYAAGSYIGLEKYVILEDYF